MRIRHKYSIIVSINYKKRVDKVASQKTIEKLAGQFVLGYLGRDIEYLDIAEMRGTEDFSDEDLRDLYSCASAILDDIRSDYENRA